MTDKKKKTSKVKKPVMTAPKKERPAGPAASMPKAIPTAAVRRGAAQKSPTGERLPETVEGMEPAAVRRWAEQAIFWLLVWALIFGAVGFFGRCCRYGWPKISISWELSPAKSSLGRWVLAERPALLKADYPAVGAELAETARRLRDGRFGGANDALADTIARVQPAVSDPAAWRLFLTRFGGEIVGGNFEKLAEQYNEAAELFGRDAAAGGMPTNEDGSRSPRCGSDGNFAVQSLIEATEVEDEKGADEIDPPVGDCDSPLGDERPDEGENLEGDGGENRGPVSGDDGESGPGRETAIEPGAGQCPTGTCPADQGYPQPAAAPRAGWVYWPWMNGGGLW